MKDEYKILIGAIIVILIVLVGAYAMSGSNNPQPTATPTALPVTATPTTVPEGGGSTGGTPSATPTAVPTAEPSPTPTTEPESGVKLTEFGYWITYPPLDPQTWSNPPPKGPQNVVYFDPTSDDVNTTFNGFSVAVDLGPHGETIVHRVGDLSGTINVTIHAGNSSNTWLIEPASIPYMYEYYVSGGNLTYEGGNTYTLKFGPGVSEQEIFVFVYNAVRSPNAQGTVKLTITGVDGGYSIGANKEFTVNINPPLPVVQFATDRGWLGNGTGCTVTQDGYVYDISIQLTRSVVLSNPLTPNLWNSTNVPDGYINSNVDDFSAGSATTYLHVSYNTSYLYGPASTTMLIPCMDFVINPSPAYIKGVPSTYHLDLLVQT